MSVSEHKSNQLTLNNSLKQKVRKWVLVLKIIIAVIVKRNMGFSIQEEVCQRELEKNPDDSLARYFLSNLYLRQNKFKEAANVLEPLSKARITDNQRMATIRNLARAYFNLGRHKDVVRVLSLLGRIPEDDISNYRLGYSIIMLGDLNPNVYGGYFMVRLNISLPENVVAAMNKEVKPGERSKFIADAIKSLLKKRREEQLIREYREAAQETLEMTADLEGTTCDGIAMNEALYLHAF